MNFLSSLFNGVNQNIQSVKPIPNITSSVASASNTKSWSSTLSLLQKPIFMVGVLNSIHLNNDAYYPGSEVVLLSTGNSTVTGFSGGKIKSSDGVVYCTYLEISAVKTGNKITCTADLTSYTDFSGRSTYKQSFSGRLSLIYF